MRVRVIGVAAILFVLGVVSMPIAPAAAQQRLTPGAVALLATQKTPQSLATLQQALTDPDVNIRRVAARVAGVGNRSQLTPRLLQQLERERDDRAAAEELRALLFIQGQQALERTQAVSLRVGGRARLALAEWLARGDPERFAAALHDLADGLTPNHVAELARIVAMSVGQHPEARQRTADAWIRTGNGRGWRSFLDALGVAALQDALLVNAGLTAPNPDVREETAWFAIVQASYGRKLPLTNVPAPEDVSAANETEWARAGRELLARLVERAKPADVARALELPPAGRVGDAQRVGALKDILTPNERAALRKGIGGELRASVSDFISPGEHVTARTFESVAPGMLSTLFETLGCSFGTDDQRSGVARVRYRADGRVSDAEVDSSALPKECAQVLGLLSTLTLADPGEVLRPDETLLLVLPADAAAVACADAPDFAGPLEPMHAGPQRNTKPPVKIRDVRPVYPEAAQQGRVQGLVVIESTMSETGCVKRSSVLRSVPGLDVAALRAVSGWRFRPALLDGKPVPVVMTVSVNFALQ